MVRLLRGCDPTREAGASCNTSALTGYKLCWPKSDRNLQGFVSEPAGEADADRVLVAVGAERAAIRGGQAE